MFIIPIIETDCYLKIAGAGLLAKAARRLLRWMYSLFASDPYSTSWGPTVRDRRRLEAKRHSQVKKSAKLEGRWFESQGRKSFSPSKYPLKSTLISGGTAANRRRSRSEGQKFKTWCQQGLFTVESLLKCTRPLVICIHNINSCVRCIG